MKRNSGKTVQIFTVHHPKTGSYMGTVTRVYGPRGGYNGSWYWTPEGSLRASEKVLSELVLHPYIDRSDCLGVLFGIQRFLEQSGGCEKCEATANTIRRELRRMETGEVKE